MSNVSRYYDFIGDRHNYSCIINLLTLEAKKIISLSSKDFVDYEKVRHLFFIKDGCELWLKLMSEDKLMINVKGDFNELLNKAIRLMKSKANFDIDNFVNSFLLDNIGHYYDYNKNLKGKIGAYNIFLKTVLSCSGVYYLIHGDDYSADLMNRLTLIRSGDYSSFVVGLDEVGLLKPHYYKGRLYTSLNDLLINLKYIYSTLSDNTVKKLGTLKVLPPIFSESAALRGKFKLGWPYNLLSIVANLKVEDLIDIYKMIDIMDFTRKFEITAEKVLKHSYELNILKDYFCYNKSIKELCSIYKLSETKIRGIVNTLSKKVWEKMNFSLPKETNKFIRVNDLYVSSDDKVYDTDERTNRLIAKHLSSLSPTGALIYERYYEIVKYIKDNSKNGYYILNEFSDDIGRILPNSEKYQKVNIVCECNLNNRDFNIIDALITYREGKSSLLRLNCLLDEYSSNSAELYRFSLILLLLKTELISKKDITNWVTMDDEMGSSVKVHVRNPVLLTESEVFMKKCMDYFRFKVYPSLPFIKYKEEAADKIVSVVKKLINIGFYSVNAVGFYIENGRLTVFKDFSEEEMNMIVYALEQCHLISSGFKLRK